MEKTFDYIMGIAISKEGYSAIFKAGIVLISAAMIAFSQIGPAIEKMDNEYFKMKYELEAKLGNVLEQVQCASVVASRADCFIAKHRAEILELSTLTLNTWVKYAGRFGLALIVLSVLLMCAHPHFPKNAGVEG